jgi:hypothetical protein
MPNFLATLPNAPGRKVSIVLKAYALTTSAARGAFRVVSGRSRG